MSRVQIISWKQHKHEDPNPNKASKSYSYPPTHRKENVSALPGSSNKPQVKLIKMSTTES